MILGEEVFRRTVPWTPHLTLVATEEVRADKAVRVTLYLKNVQDRKVCEFKDGELSFELGGLAGLLGDCPPGEKLCLAVLPRDFPSTCKDFPSVLRDPFWQDVLDLISVHYVLRS